MNVLDACEVRGSADCSEKLLKSHLQAYIPAPRRVDRLILQSLLAGVRLLPKLQPACGLYLAAEQPCHENMSRLLDSVVLQEKLPKPLEFVNSVSNAAGFYLAQKLGLEGPNLFIGAGPDHWQQLCQLACVDLAEGICQQALLIHCQNRGDFVVRGLLLDGQEGLLDSRSFAHLSAHIDVQHWQIEAADSLNPA